MQPSYQGPPPYGGGMPVPAPVYPQQPMTAPHPRRAGGLGTVLSLVAVALAAAALVLSLVIPGPAGPAGTNGADGATGPIGPTGPRGPAGAGTLIVSQVRVTSGGLVMAGCMNYMRIDVSVPGPGTVVLTTSMHFWIEHTVGTTDGITFLHRNASTDCSLSFVAVPAWFITEISADAPTDSLVNVDGTLMTPYQVPAAGTYAYYVNAQMLAGQSANDRIVDAASAAVFYPG